MKRCGRDPNDLLLPVDGPPNCATSRLAVYLADIDTGKPRNVTKDDLAKFVRLADALDGVGYVWTSMTLSDVPILTLPFTPMPIDSD